jgi:hypothetical protein
MTLDRKIWVTFALPGIHRYPNAPDDVAYLRDPHRHLFKFRVTVNVLHNDREIEFHQFLNFCTSQYATGTLQLNYKSCEMLAEELITVLSEKYKNRLFEVEVSEDGECGAIVTSDFTQS